MSSEVFLFEPAPKLLAELETSKDLARDWLDVVISLDADTVDSDVCGNATLKAVQKVYDSDVPVTSFSAEHDQHIRNLFKAAAVLYNNDRYVREKNVVLGRIIAQLDTTTTVDPSDTIETLANFRKAAGDAGQTSLTGSEFGVVEAGGPREIIRKQFLDSWSQRRDNWLAPYLSKL